MPTVAFGTVGYIIYSLDTVENIGKIVILNFCEKMMFCVKSFL